MSNEPKNREFAEAIYEVMIKARPDLADSPDILEEILKDTPFTMRKAPDDGQRECEWAKIDGMRRFKTKCGTISHTAYITPFCYNCGGKVRLREKDDGS